MRSTSTVRPSASVARPPLDAGDLRPGEDLDLVLDQRLREGSRGVVIASRRDPIAALDDRDPRAEPGEGLGELEPDGATADNEHRFGAARRGRAR